MNSRFWRALLAFVALPGVVAFAIPLWMLPRPQTDTVASGFVVAAVGALILLQCVRDFYVAGKGTLAPWSPPRHLVTTGLYRFSRNPMYVGVTTILVGWAIAYQSGVHAIYAASILVAFYLRVVFFEEPWLAATHGRKWQAYRARVTRRFVW
jgi:protein-S-isoprenylcysteine O-methyltransferase Ste14